MPSLGQQGFRNPPHQYKAHPQNPMKAPKEAHIAFDVHLLPFCRFHGIVAREDVLGVIFCEDEGKEEEEGAEEEDDEVGHDGNVEEFV